MNFENCPHCTILPRCVAGDVELCTGVSHGDIYSHVRHSQVDNYLRRGGRIGAVSNHGIVIGTCYDREMFVAGCVDNGTLRTVPADDLIFSGTGYTSALGTTEPLPAWINTDGAHRTPCSVHSSRPSADWTWYITVRVELYNPRGDRFAVAIAADGKALTTTHSTLRGAAEHLNACAIKWEMRPEKTFIFGIDVQPDLFGCTFLETGIIGGAI